MERSCHFRGGAQGVPIIIKQPAIFCLLCHSALLAPTMSKLDTTTLGAIEIGALISIFMFGLLILQVFRYFRRFPNDPLILKGMVCYYVSYCMRLWIDLISGRRSVVSLSRSGYGRCPT